MSSYNYKLWIRWQRVLIATEYYKLDLSKNFFELSDEEMHKVCKMRDIFGFSGKNSLGRSPARQFYYYLQKSLPF